MPAFVNLAAARAAALVAALNGSISNAPSGPFQISVLQPSKTLVSAATVFGPASKIIFGFSHGVFPVILTVAAAVRNLRPILMTSARSMGAKRWHLFRYVILPHIVPGFFAGQRLAMTAVLLGVLLAELYASSNGIGHFTRQFTESFDPARLLGLIALVALLAILLNTILKSIEKRFP